MCAGISADTASRSGATVDGFAVEAELRLLEECEVGEGAAATAAVLLPEVAPNPRLSFNRAADARAESFLAPHSYSSSVQPNDVRQA